MTTRLSTILAGHYDDMERMDEACRQLAAQGFAPDEYARYFLNPPGQHGLFPLGGDVFSDEGARGAGKGAAAGAAIGAAAGAALGSFAAGPIGALAGAGTGAYVGSLAGALSQTHAPREHEASKEHPAERSGGPMLAVCVDRPGSETAAMEIFARTGAREVERAEGEWLEGRWRDHDPRVPTETVAREDDDATPTGHA